MMKNKKLILLCWSLLLSGTLMTACDSDNEPMNQPPRGEGPVAFTLAVDQSGTIDWNHLDDRRLAVEIDGVVKQYQITPPSTVSSEDPFQWEGRDTLVVQAWYPYSTRMLRRPIVKPNQNLETDYRASNLLGTGVVKVAPDNTTITLLRRTAQVQCELVKGMTCPAECDLEAATVTLLGLSDVEVGTSVTTNADRCAYIAPQEIETGTPFVRLSWENSNEVYTYVVPADESIVAGVPYKVTITVEEGDGSLCITPLSASDWNTTDETLSGVSYILAPELNPDEWKDDGEAGTLNGTSSTITPGANTAADWEKEEEILTGEKQNKTTE